MTFRKHYPLIFISLILVFIVFEGSFIPHFCLFEKTLNLHCPFCGVTKSFEELLSLNFLEAFKLNFMSYGIILFFLLKYFFDLLEQPNYTLKLNTAFTFLCLIQFFKSNLFF